MAKRQFQISASALKKLHATLKKYEIKHPKMFIGKIKASNFLISNLESPSLANPTLETKQKVLNIAGDFSTKPEDLADSVLLIDNLNYNDDQFSLLQSQLDALVKKCKGSASVSQTETNKCKSVGDCVKLVNSKIQ